jgi:type IV pilus assembly protein PilY1
VAGFPGDPRKGTTYGQCYVPAEAGSNSLYQRWYRSPDINTIWYNPEVRYQPWLKPKAGGGWFRRAHGGHHNAKAAPWDPVTTGLNPATFDLVTKRNITTTWCTA